MSAGPSVVRLVLFKHGVAYLERSGPAEGSFDLSFKHDEMSDVLKSLAVWVPGGGAAVTTVSFDAPTNPEDDLSERKLHFPVGEALRGWLSSLRGRRVRIRTAKDKVEGELVGLQAEQRLHGATGARLMVRPDDSHITLVDVSDIDSFRLLDNASRDDLSFLVERSRASMAGKRRSVRVQLSGPADDVRAAYVLPAPTWRVSYRIVADGSNDDERERDLLLMAWGIVHNPADEDLAGVKLTLTTGQPVSFSIDLYNPKRLQRAVVQETSRVAAAPRTIERAKRAAAPPAAPAAFGAPPAPRMAAAAPPPPGSAPAPAALMEMAAMEASAGSASTDERGELFEYHVEHPVDLARGGSAMVPLANVRIPGKKERLWRDGQGPNPDLVLSFENKTGLVLEEGPAVLYDGGAYAGEAMVPYSARGASVRLPYAKDLAVRCQQRTQHRTISTGVRLDRNGLIEQRRRETDYILRADSDQSDPIHVLFEIARPHNFKLKDGSLKPMEETANAWRFDVEVADQSFSEITIQTYWVEELMVATRHLSAAQLALWMKNKLLDDVVAGKLSDILQKRQRAGELDIEIQRLNGERDQLYTKQQRISEQLGVLKDQGPEGQLRLRYVGELQTAQDAINQIDRAIEQVRNDADNKRREAERMLEELIANA